MASRFASDGAMQVMGYSNRELDHALAAAGRQTDPIVRAAAYQKAQRLLAEDLPIVPLYEIVDIVAFRDGLRGVPQDDARGLVPFHTYNLVRLPGAR
jgi:peptide/nickel transport system substrate-binding protein